MSASLAALCIYLFNFGNQVRSGESMFWAMPMVCPVAFVVYLKSKRIGAAVQLVLYSSAIFGAYQMIEGECRLGNCSTHNPAAILIDGMFAGVHMIAMFGALALMSVEAAKMFRSHPVA